MTAHTPGSPAGAPQDDAQLLIESKTTSPKNFMEKIDEWMAPDFFIGAK